MHLQSENVCVCACAGTGDVKIWCTQPESIDRAEDRDQWFDLLTELKIDQPPGDMVTSEDEALKAAQKLGYPVMVRPSFVLGGRAMEIVYRCIVPPACIPGAQHDQSGSRTCAASKLHHALAPCCAAGACDDATWATRQLHMQGRPFGGRTRLAVHNAMQLHASWQA